MPYKAEAEEMEWYFQHDQIHGRPFGGFPDRHLSFMPVEEGDEPIDLTKSKEDEQTIELTAEPPIGN